MAQNVIINSVTYNNVPEVDIPISGGGTAKFYDVSDADISSAASLRNGVKAAGPDGTVYTGSMTEKAAATYTPSASDQVISANQFLAGSQTIEGVVVTNLSAANIAAGVTVKIGTATDDDSIAEVTGTLSAAVISQDSTTKVLSIS